MLNSIIGILPGVPNISIVRMFRILRPLRTLSVIPGMKKIVTSLLAAIPALVNVMVLQIFVFFIFGILGIQLFSGQLHSRCRSVPFPVMLEKMNMTHYRYPPTDVHLHKVVSQPEEYQCLKNTLLYNNIDDITNTTKDTSPWFTPQPCFWPVDPTDTQLCTLTGGGRHDCSTTTTCGSNYDGWGNARFTMQKAMDNGLYSSDFNYGYTTFDSISAAFLTIFQSITMEGWTDIMYLCQDAVHPLLASLFFILLVVFGSFFLLNLTLAVICEEFHMEENEINQQEVQVVNRTEVRDYVPIRGPVPGLYTMIQSKGFSFFILFLILLNTSVLSMDHHPMPDGFNGVLEIVNFILSLLFFLEMMLKVLGLGFHQYCQDRFNIFDMFIVLTGIIETVVLPPSFMTSMHADEASGGGALSALRTFRLFRIFKLARNWTSLRVLLATIIQTLSSIVNFGILLILFLYIYSLIGIQVILTI